MKLLQLIMMNTIFIGKIKKLLPVIWILFGSLICVTKTEVSFLAGVAMIAVGIIWLLKNYIFK